MIRSTKPRRTYLNNISGITDQESIYAKAKHTASRERTDSALQPTGVSVKELSIYFSVLKVFD